MHILQQKKSSNENTLKMLPMIFGKKKIIH